MKAKKCNLSSKMTLDQFDNGYWYATELKKFARIIGIPRSNNLRKDEIERAIRMFLNSGRIERPSKRNSSRSSCKDVEHGLHLSLPIVVYTNDTETKDFLDREGRKLSPGMTRKSGVRYRLNRWREEQLAKGAITYGDLVKEYVRLNLTREPFAKIPYDCYINFLSDFLAGEKDAKREQAISAWREVKEIDGPKNYDSWVKLRS